MKSIVIIGKGASIERSNASYIDSFDEVAICNNPVYRGYEHLISNHATYHFKTDLSVTNEFPSEMSATLGIEKVIHTGAGSWLRKQFRFKNLDPSTGTLAFSYFLANPTYNRISMVGFDLFLKGSKVYYFKPNEIDSRLQYLFDNGSYSKDGFVSNVESGHQELLTADYMTLCFMRFQDVSFELITNYPFEYAGKNIKYL